MGSSRSIIVESSGYRTLTESLASQSSRVEHFSHQRTLSAERHGKRSERFAPVRSRAPITKFWSFKFRLLSTSCRFQPRSV